MASQPAHHPERVISNPAGQYRLRSVAARRDLSTNPRAPQTRDSADCRHVTVGLSDHQIAASLHRLPGRRLGTRCGLAELAGSRRGGLNSALSAGLQSLASRQAPAATPLPPAASVARSAPPGRSPDPPVLGQRARREPAVSHAQG
jgi:hypothetical protein